MITDEQVQKLVDQTSQLVLREDGLPKQPGDHVDAVSRRLAKRVLELEESYNYMKACRDDLQEKVEKLKEACAYLLIVRKDTMQGLKELAFNAEVMAAKAKNLKEEIGIRRPGITLEELQDAPADEGCDSEA